VDHQTSLPDAVVNLIKSASYGEFATISAAGVPIDTPLLSFPEEDISKIGMATGVAYPTKAERARRNPKVGLLYEGTLPGEPAFVSIAGIAAVRDSNIQANVLKYISETALMSDPKLPWSAKSKAVWYWSRILIDVFPKEILWWDSAADLDKAPHRWTAPAGTVFPASDPAPPGKASAAPKWDQPPWQTQAKDALSRNAAGHLSVVDADGFPRPMRTSTLRGADGGFVLTLPKHAPGARSGSASLTFFGRETFIGTLQDAGAGELKLMVERALPILPLVADSSQTWNPSSTNVTALFDRLKAELARRNQSIPTVPEEFPAQTVGARRRAARDAALTKPSLDRITTASDAG